VTFDERLAELGIELPGSRYGVAVEVEALFRVR
jgi:hypothetical protein